MAVFGTVNSAHDLVSTDISDFEAAVLAAGGGGGLAEPLNLSKRMTIWPTAPTVDPTGGVLGIGSNKALDTIANMDMDPRYFSSANFSSTTRLNLGVNIPQAKGSVGTRIKGNGTLNAVSSGATAVTGTGSNFTSGSPTAGTVITAVSISSGVFTYYNSTIASVTNDTSLTLQTPFVDYSGTQVAVPSGAIYSINPRKITSDQLTTFNVNGGLPYGGTNVHAINMNCAHNGYGVLSPLELTVTVNDAGARGGPSDNGWCEVSGLSNHITNYRKGVACTNEWGMTNNAGAPSRSASLTLVNTDLNAYSVYASDGSFNGGGYYNTSMRTICILNNVSGMRTGTAMFVAGRTGAGYQRFLVLNDGATAYDTPGTDLFTIDGWGNAGWDQPCNQTSFTSGYPVRLLLGGMAGTVAQGMQFGNDSIGTTGFAPVQLFRPSAGALRLNATLVMGGSLNALGNINLTATDGTGLIRMQEQTVAAATPASGVQTHTYMKGDKYVIQYNHGGTVKYRWLDLTSTDALWTYSTVAP